MITLPEYYLSTYNAEELIVAGEFNPHNNCLPLNTFDDSGNWHPEFWLTVNQVKDLMAHLQRALDEHGDKTQ